ncbi:hypothetical protein EAY14_24160 [Escherichia coli]|nr:hypothetical protein [Escherichia coli]
MNINAGHEITSKARIIHQIQLIRGITHMQSTARYNLFSSLSGVLLISSENHLKFTNSYISSLEEGSSDSLGSET